MSVDVVTGVVTLLDDRHRYAALAADGTGRVFALLSSYLDTAVHANDREGLERLCRYGARGPIAECRLRKLTGDLYEYTPKRGVTFTLTAADLVRRLVALVPPAKSHLTSFHGAYAPQAKLRPLVTGTPASVPSPPPKRQIPKAAKRKATRPRLDWASLHQHTFGNDVLRCPCGGRHTIRALFSTHKAAEERLAALGGHCPVASCPTPPLRHSSPSPCEYIWGAPGFDRRAHSPPRHANEPSTSRFLAARTQPNTSNDSCSLSTFATVSRFVLLGLRCSSSRWPSSRPPLRAWRRARS